MIASQATQITRSDEGDDGFRLLFVDVNATFINPTRNLLPQLLCEVGSVKFFGPGYVTRDVLDQGLRRFVDAEGPFDFLFTNTHVTRALPDGQISPGYRTSYALSFPYDDLSALSDIRLDWASIDIPRVILLFENDFYNFTEDQIDELDRNADFLVGLGQELFGLLAELPKLGNEPWGARANDNWANYVRRQPQRIVSMPLFVGEAEFSRRRLAHRSIEWSIPGSQYRARLDAAEVFREAGIEFDSRNPAYLLQLIRQKLRILRRERLFTQRIVNLLFWMQLERSRYVYTCGSGLEIPVRKVFEIPASGAVLVCSPFRGFEALGFRHWENAIVAPPKDLPTVHRQLMADAQRAQSIADSGRQLVTSKHSISARARDLRRTLSAIRARSFGGSRWEKGQFTLVARRDQTLAAEQAISDSR